MKLTLIRTDRETGKESFSTLEAENLIAKIKKENKAAHVSALRHLIPILQGTNNHYQNIDKLPRIYPAVEYARTKDRLAISKVAYFGRALRKLGISSRRRNRGTEYHVIINETAFQ